MDQEAILEHYATGYERARLGGGTSRIEFARTKELLQRFLPPPPAAVLDVGGGPGVYAAWLADLEYGVHLVDPVPLHVEQASEASERSRHPFTAAVGDARGLTQKDSSFDAVVVLGPSTTSPRSGFLGDRPSKRSSSATCARTAPKPHRPRRVFHDRVLPHPDELRGEVEDAGLRFEAILGIEGPGWLVPGLWG